MADDLGAATRALDRADAVQKELDQRGRPGQSWTGHTTQTNRLWRPAERLWDQATAAETAWKQVKSAFEFFTPEGRFNDRCQAEAVVAVALPHLTGPAWAKSRRWLRRRESFTFLDQAPDRLIDLGLDPDVLSALLDLEGLRRQPWRSRTRRPVRRPRAWALARTVQLAKTDPDGGPGASAFARCCAGCGVRAAWWNASPAWRGCSRRATAR